MIVLGTTIERSTGNAQLAVAAYGGLFCWILIMAMGILYLNEGHFIYTLDDPYIHLAMSEEIHAGGYGINHAERSAASSSILFPYLLAWAAPYAFHEYLPLAINLAALAATIAGIRRFLSEIGIDRSAEGRIYATVLTVTIPLAVNLVGLAFMGMENSLQVLLDLLVFLGLIRSLARDRIDWWLPAALVLAPMVRYESTLISGLALLVLARRGWWMQAILTGLVIAGVLIAFSLYLVALGLPPLPSSVIAHSRLADDAVTGSGAGAIALRAVVHFILNILSIKGMVLVLIMLGLGYVAFRARHSSRPATDRLVAAFGLLACGIYLVCGQISVSDRHETSMFTLAILIVIYLARRQLLNALDRRLFSRLSVYSFLLLAAVGVNFARGAVLIPISSNNIYEQQYQLHRLVTEYIRGPVAANDIGWISYRNDAYVLDLWGLASHSALQVRRTGYTAASLERVVEQSGAELILIYDSWFKGITVRSWTPMARLHTSRPNIYAADRIVSIYAPRGADTAALYRKLEAFARTLPHGVQLDLL